MEIDEPKPVYPTAAADQPTTANPRVSDRVFLHYIRTNNLEGLRNQVENSSPVLLNLLVSPDKENANEWMQLENWPRLPFACSHIEYCRCHHFRVCPWCAPTYMFEKLTVPQYCELMGYTKLKEYVENELTIEQMAQIQI